MSKRSVFASGEQGFVPPRTGSANGFHRRQSQTGMIAGGDVRACSNCSGLTAPDQMWSGWCFSCVLNWGHPDDAADVVRLNHGWTREAAIAAVVESKCTVNSAALAVQTLGEIDLTTATTHGVGRFGIEHRTSPVASDGFLFDDEPAGGTGRMTAETHQHYEEAVLRLVESGMSLRAIARTTGLSRSTVRVWLKKHRVVAVCACGDPASHQGWCAERFAASAKRQTFMRRWHPKGAWSYTPVDGFHIAWGMASGGGAGADPCVRRRGISGPIRPTTA